MPKLKENNNIDLNIEVSDSINKLKTIGTILENQTVEVKEKKEKSKNIKLINLKVTESKKEAYEKFFGAQGLSLSSAIRMSLDYIMLQGQAGNLLISESGIHENILNRLS